MKTWHYNYVQEKSIIQEMLSLLKDDNILNIYTEDDCLTATSEDEVQIGDGAMMINSSKHILLINTHKIVYCELIRSTTNNIQNGSQK
jgi:hypothetical protein